MKTILLTLAMIMCLLIGPSLYAQGVIIKGGVNISDYNELNNYYDPYDSSYASEITEFRPGFNVGVNFDLFRIGDKYSFIMSFAPYLTYNSIYRKSVEYYPRAMYANAEDTIYMQGTKTFLFVNYPVNFKYLQNFGDWQGGIFAGVGTGFYITGSSNYPGRTQTFFYNYGLTACYNKFTAEFVYSRTVAELDDNESTDFDLHSYSINFGYVIY